MCQPFRNGFHPQNDFVGRAEDRHSTSRRSLKSKSHGVGDCQQFLPHILVSTITGNLDPTLPLIMKHREMLGLIILSVAAPVVVQCEDHVSRIIHADKRKIVRHVYEGWNRPRRGASDCRLNRPCRIPLRVNN